MRTLILTIVAVFSITQAPKTTEFVGTTSCSDAMRTFVGGLATIPSCRTITWRLTLPAQGSGRWTLAALISIPSDTNPNAHVEGPTVIVDGTVEQTRGAAFDRSAPVYQLTAGEPGRTVSLVAISGSVLHFIDANGALLNGTSGYSYTLVDAGRAESRPADMPSAEGSYTIPPKATGPSVLGIFGGRSGCSSLVRVASVAGPCGRVKWRVTLFQDVATGRPTTYQIDGTLHHPGREGAWSIIRGTESNPNATLYRLDGTATEGPIWLLKGDNNVLFFSDRQGVPLIGSKDFAYTLNRDS